jgi:hypothetical protein
MISYERCSNSGLPATVHDSRGEATPIPSDSRRCSTRNFSTLIVIDEITP